MTNDDKSWNYLNTYLNIDDFVKKFKCSFNYKKLYKKGKWYVMTYQNHFAYDL